MTPWRRTLLLRRRALRRVWLLRVRQLSELVSIGAITDRHAERLMAELGECP